MTTVHIIAAATHGRYLLEPPAGTQPEAIVAGFHGYAEAAETHLERIRSIPGSGRWLLASVQGLNRFYRSRTQQVIASWMTRQDRELAISDNVAYVNAVLEAVAGEWPALPLVITGFSQGVAMAFRAACGSPRPVAAVIAFGGDVPPELDRAALGRIPAALLGRGVRDDWYTEAKNDADMARLRDAGVQATSVAVDAAHEWTDVFSREASAFLRRLRT